MTLPNIIAGNLIKAGLKHPHAIFYLSHVELHKELDFIIRFVELDKKFEHRKRKFVLVIIGPTHRGRDSQNESDQS